MDIGTIFDMVLIIAYFAYWTAIAAWTLFKWKIIIAIAIPIVGILYKYLKSRPVANRRRY